MGILRSARRKSSESENKVHKVALISKPKIEPLEVSPGPSIKTGNAHHKVTIKRMASISSVSKSVKVKKEAQTSAGMMTPEGEIFKKSSQSSKTGAWKPGIKRDFQQLKATPKQPVAKTAFKKKWVCPVILRLAFKFEQLLYILQISSIRVKPCFIIY